MTATHLAIGEPANIMSRSKAKLIRDFITSEKHLKQIVKASAIDPHQQAHKEEKPHRYYYDILRKSRLNYNHQPAG